jgi:predicted RNA polymerase sigma factor
MITTASDEMQLFGGHQASLLVVAKKNCDIRPRRPHLYKKRKGGPAPSADMYRRLGRTAEARSSYEKALALTQQEPERQFLQERIRQLK